MAEKWNKSDVVFLESGCIQNPWQTNGAKMEKCCSKRNPDKIDVETWDTSHVVLFQSKDVHIPWQRNEAKVAKAINAAKVAKACHITNPDKIGVREMGQK